MSKRKQGELEAQVLGCLWDRPDGLSSQQILAMLGDDSLAITTVLTVLTRLCEKGIVEKTPGIRRALLFRAIKTREQSVSEQLLQALSDTNSTAVLAHFAAGLSTQQREKLRSLLN